VITGIAVMFLLIPGIDPKKENIEKFKKYYDGFVILFISFMVAVHLQILLWNVGIRISPNTVLPAGTGLLFYYIGVLMENAESNWFISIRTPWTLSSDRVWKKTNRLGGKMFRIAGIIAISGSFFPKLAVFLLSCLHSLLQGLRLFTLIMNIFKIMWIENSRIVYSYVEYQKELKETGSQIKP
jgi:uncharacterized membrane protein